MKVRLGGRFQLKRGIEKDFWQGLGGSDDAKC